MTPLDLMQSLKAYTEESTKDMMLITRAEISDTEVLVETSETEQLIDQATERPPLVFIGSLPDKEGNTKQAPYILLKLLTGKDEDEESVCRVRIIITTYAKDDQENYIQCLNVITRIRTRLLSDVVIENRYSCQKPIEYIIYDNDTAPYQIGELMTIWELPKIEREVGKWLR